MKLYLCFILFFISIMTIFAQVSEENVVVAKTNADKLRDIKNVKVLVEKFTEEYKTIGFDEIKISSFVSEKLRNNNCLDPYSDDYLYININPIKIDDNTFAASVHVSLNRPVYYPAEDKTFITMATVWQTGSIIIFPTNTLEYINDCIDKLTDKFILDWYKSQIPYKEDGSSNDLKINQDKKDEPKNKGQVDENYYNKKGQEIA